MGLELYENLKIECRRRKRKMPDVIIFSETELTEDEKDNIMEKFSQQNGTIKILIATTVITVR